MRKGRRRRNGVVSRFVRKELATSRPGERFQARYWRRRRSPRALPRRIAFLAMGVTVIAAGVVLLPAPGPGTLVIIFGTALLAEESLMMAKLLDAFEVRARIAGRALASTWRRTPVVLRTAGVLAAVGGLAGLTFLAWRLLLER